MSNIFICSDLHLSHDKDFIFIPRGFSSIEEHDAEIVRRWNSVVSPDDIVYVLGDVIVLNLESGMKYLEQLNGHIYIIPGNHDSVHKIEEYKKLPNVQVLNAVCGGLLPASAMIKYKKYYLCLSHFPTLCNNYDEDKPLKARCINLCGHSHTKDKFADMDKGIIYHVEMDAHDCYPIELDKVIEEIKEYHIECLT